MSYANCANRRIFERIKNIFGYLKQQEMQLEEFKTQPQRFIEYGYSMPDDQSISTQLEKARSSIQKLASRNGWKSDRSECNAIQTLFPTYNGDATFCDGALHLQNHPEAPLPSISTKLPDGTGYKCSYCSLEFRSAEICLSEQGCGLVYLAENKWRNYAKHHIQACASFKNLAAWYMCLVCHDWGHGPPQIFASPLALKEHMKSHNGQKVRDRS